jgi:membrane protease YdiL (CAAX protease family)
MIPELSTMQAIFLTTFTLAFWWSEIPEELFFRGYLQNQMQEIAGKNAAVIFSALCWALAHLWGLANTLERFTLGLAYAIVFRIRQNTTGPMIAHPVGNRALILSFIIPQIFGTSPGSSTINTWLYIVGIYIVLIVIVKAGWQALKLDRKP